MIKINPNDENWKYYCKQMKYILNVAEELGIEVDKYRGKVAIDIPFVAEVIRRAMERGDKSD